MDSKFVQIAGDYEIERLTKQPFDKTRLEEAFKTLREMDWDPKEFALAGSAALYVLSTTQLGRGQVPLITRLPGDLDILVTGDTARRAKDKGIVTDSNIGGQQIKLILPENKGELLDLTTRWPTSTVIKNANDLAQVSIDVGGLRIMVPEAVLNMKDKFSRDKDIPDLKTAVVSHRMTANPFPVKPKVKP